MLRQGGSSSRPGASKWECSPPGTAEAGGSGDGARQGGREEGAAAAQTSGAAEGDVDALDAEVGRVVGLGVGPVGPAGGKEGPVDGTRLDGGDMRELIVTMREVLLEAKRGSYTVGGQAHGTGGNGLGGGGSGVATVALRTTPVTLTGETVAVSLQNVQDFSLERMLEYAGDVSNGAVKGYLALTPAKDPSGERRKLMLQMAGLKAITMNARLCALLVVLACFPMAYGAQRGELLRLSIVGNSTTSNGISLTCSLDGAAVWMSGTAEQSGAPQRSTLHQFDLYARLARAAAQDKCSASASTAGILGTLWVGGYTDAADFAVVSRGANSPVMQTALRGRADGFLSQFDPQGVLLYSTFWGGSGNEEVTAMARSLDGNRVWAVGSTDSRDFGQKGAYFQRDFGGGVDATFGLLDSRGSMLVAGLFGGADEDRASGVAVDALGSAWVVGSTCSNNFRITTAAISSTVGRECDGFLVNIARTGALLFSTGIGGAAWDSASAVAIDIDGMVWVVGSTSSNDFPQLPAKPLSVRRGVDTFVAMFAPQGQLRFSSVFGGSADDHALAAVPLPLSGLFFAGFTESRDLMPSKAAQSRQPDASTWVGVDGPQPQHGGGRRDGFLALVSPEGVLTYSTYLGGDGNDVVHGLAVVDQKQLWVTGMTEVTAGGMHGLPVTGGGTQPSGSGARSFLAVFRNELTVIESVSVSPRRGWARAGALITVNVTVARSEEGLQPATTAATTINGEPVGFSFQERGRGVYSFSYTLQATDRSWASGALPVQIYLVDAAGNRVFHSGTTDGNQLIGKPQAQPPLIASVQEFPATGYVAPGGVVSVMLHVSTLEEGLRPSSRPQLIAGRDVRSSFYDFGNGSYVFNFTHNGSGGGDGGGRAPFTWSVQYPLPLQLSLVDAAGNVASVQTTTRGSSGKGLSSIVVMLIALTAALVVFIVLIACVWVAILKRPLPGLRARSPGGPGGSSTPGMASVRSVRQHIDERRERMKRAMKQEAARQWSINPLTDARLQGPYVDLARSAGSFNEREGASGGGAGGGAGKSDSPSWAQNSGSPESMPHGLRHHHRHQHDKFEDDFAAMPVNPMYTDEPVMPAAPAASARQWSSRSPDDIYASVYENITNLDALAERLAQQATQPPPVPWQAKPVASSRQQQGLLRPAQRTHGYTGQSPTPWPQPPEHKPHHHDELQPPQPLQQQQQQAPWQQPRQPLSYEAQRDLHHQAVVDEYQHELGIEPGGRSLTAPYVAGQVQRRQQMPAGADAPGDWGRSASPTAAVGPQAGREGDWGQPEDPRASALLPGYDVSPQQTSLARQPSLGRQVSLSAVKLKPTDGDRGPSVDEEVVHAADPNMGGFVFHE
eukprot:jgi/Mesvir1/28497/Mv15909-RA.1